MRPGLRSRWRVCQHFAGIPGQPRLAAKKAGSAAALTGSAPRPGAAHERACAAPSSAQLAAESTASTVARGSARRCMELHAAAGAGRRGAATTATLPTKRRGASTYAQAALGRRMLPRPARELAAEGALRERNGTLFFGGGAFSGMLLDSLLPIEPRAAAAGDQRGRRRLMLSGDLSGCWTEGLLSTAIVKHQRLITIHSDLQMRLLPLQ